MGVPKEHKALLRVSQNMSLLCVSQEYDALPYVPEYDLFIKIHYNKFNIPDDIMRGLMIQTEGRHG